MLAVKLCGGLRPERETTPACCTGFIHENCLKKMTTPACPSCNTQWKMLPCCWCREHICRPNATVPETYLAFVNGVEYRTKCCKADLHPQCFDHVSGPCPVCQVEWNRDRQPITENRGGAEYAFLTQEPPLHPYTSQFKLTICSLVSDLRLRT